MESEEGRESRKGSEEGTSSSSARMCSLEIKAGKPSTHPCIPDNVVYTGQRRKAVGGNKDDFWGDGGELREYPGPPSEGENPASTTVSLEAKILTLTEAVRIWGTSREGLAGEPIQMGKTAGNEEGPRRDGRTPSRKPPA